MNVENLVSEAQQTPDTQPSVAVEPMPEITPLPFETFKLIGGGSSAVLD